MKTFAASVHALSLYGASGIVAFGWAMGRLLHFPVGYYGTLWFLAAVFVYNIDRLKHDPADAINTPRRIAASERLREISRILVAVAAFGLVVIPLVARDWIVLALTISGALFCMTYSIPIAGMRLKDVPLLKTFFAPGLVTAAIFALPFLHGQLLVGMLHLSFVVIWSGAFLLFNMILCDQRDLLGDRQTGTRSLPAVLGPRRTLGVQAALFGILLVAAIGAAFTVNSQAAFVWLALSLLAPLYLGGLLLALRHPRGEHFYEWWVEGMLFLPAVAVLITAF